MFGRQTISQSFALVLLRETRSLASKSKDKNVPRKRQMPDGLDADTNGRAAFLIICIMLFGIGEVFLLSLLIP